MTNYLVHCRPDMRRLAAWAARTRLSPKGADLGYTVHALLAATFGHAAPKPFYLGDEATGLIGYTQTPVSALIERAALAPPEEALALGLDPSRPDSGFSVRAFPAQWPAGKVLGFAVRVRPVVRCSTRRETDAFLHAIQSAAPRNERDEMQRERVYRDWLKHRLTSDGGCELLEAAMTSFKLTDVLRRTQKNGAGDRKGHVLPGPDATFSGHLQVVDPAVFAGLLAHGIGRHRAFGYGMLRLRPANR